MQVVLGRRNQSSELSTAFVLLGCRKSLSCLLIAKLFFFKLRPGALLAQSVDKRRRGSHEGHF